MLIRFFMALLAIFFPWLVFLLEDNPGAALIALVMQASILGWPFAAVWALRIQSESRKARISQRKKAKKKKAKEKAKKEEEESEEELEEEEEEKE